MFISKYEKILSGYTTSDMDFDGICYALKLNDKKIDDLLCDKKSIEELFEAYYICLDNFTSLSDDLYFNEKNTIKCIRAIYKHGLEKNEAIANELNRFIHDFNDSYEYFDDLREKFDKCKNELKQIGLLV